MLRNIRIIIVLIALVLFQSLMTRDDSFVNYCQFLKRVELPLILDCEQNIHYPDYSNIPKSLNDKYRPLGHKTLGRLDIEENIITIIQVAQAENEFPMIFSYTKDGTPIDTISLLSGSCSSSAEYAEHSVTSIDFDKNILMTDSAYYFDIDKDGYRQSLDSIVIFNWNLEMSNGHFERIMIDKTKK